MTSAERALPVGWEEAWKHVQQAVAKVETKYSGTKTGKQSPMFVFVDQMMRFRWSDGYKDNPEAIADLIEAMQAEHVRTFRAFYKYGPDRDIGREDFWNWHSIEGGREEFISVWMSRRYRPNENPLDAAIADLKLIPVRVLGPTLYGTIVGIAYHLQNRLGDREIVLPQGLIAEKLGVSQRAVSGYLSAAVQSGLLRAVSGYNFAAHQAKRYCFVGKVKEFGDHVEVTSNRV